MISIKVLLISVIYSAIFSNSRALQCTSALVHVSVTLKIPVYVQVYKNFPLQNRVMQGWKKGLRTRSHLSKEERQDEIPSHILVLLIRFFLSE
jgi:hypothetical protein